ncbi:MAG: hypothetical protein IPH18_14330 [Chitinophagaceae bacterium]|nr:hypothetical protein [Chitinophagaceae bacterium]MBK8953037.1 hypothetical protein [Chitinophagaceae bacterium]
MNISENPFTITIAGITAIIVLTIAGSVLSRVLKFNYSIFSLFSVVIYIATAWLVAEKTGFVGAITSSVSLGIFDAIAGWELSNLFKANIGEMKDELEKISVHTRVTGMIFFAALFGLVGYWLS